MEQSVDCELAGEIEVLGENLPQCHFVHHKSWPEPRRWEAVEQPPELWHDRRSRFVRTWSDSTFIHFHFCSLAEKSSSMKSLSSNSMQRFNSDTPSCMHWILLCRQAWQTSYEVCRFLLRQCWWVYRRGSRFIHCKKFRFRLPIVVSSVYNSDFTTEQG
jgi:hypothetical protein